MFPAWYVSDKSRCCVLNALKVYGWYGKKETVAVVQAGRDECVYQGLDSLVTQILPYAPDVI